MRWLKQYLWVGLLLVWQLPAHAETVAVLPKDAKIIVVGGALSEIVHAIGAREQMIGRDSTSTYPEAVRALPDIGYMRALSPEGVLSLEPQGLVLSEGSGPPQALEVLQKLSLPIVMVPEDHSRDGVAKKIAMIGQALSREIPAQAVIGEVEQDFAKLDRLLARAIPEKCEAVFGQELRKNKELEQMERSKNRDL